MRKGLIFDLDGVIVDTAKFHYLAWKQVAAELDLDFTKKDNERLKGVSRKRSFEIILELSGKEMPEEEQLIYRTKKNMVYRSYIETLTQADCLPGVVDFIKKAKSNDYGIALGSASKNAPFILEKLGMAPLFDCVIDGNLVSRAKPDPEVFLKGAESLGLHPTDCLVFEDAIAGIEAAQAGGMTAIGVGSPKVLIEADYIISGFDRFKYSDFKKKVWDK